MTSSSVWPVTTASPLATKSCWPKPTNGRSATAASPAVPHSNLSTILGELKNAVNKLNDVEARCAQLAEENKKKDEELAKLTNSITNVGNMVSIGFLDTKGISADAKVKISESVAFLANNGLDISKTQQAIDSMTQKANEKVEAIFQAREIVDTNAKESEEKAAATETEAISIMNKIVETHEQ